MTATEQGNDNREPCDLCGRLFDPGELEYDSGTGRWLCPDCMAELQSCGCFDE